MKKTLALVMALALAAGSAAYAADTITEQGTQKQEVDVTLNVACTYTVSIPAAAVEFSSTQTTVSKTVEVTAASIDATADHEHVLTVTVGSDNYDETAKWRMKGPGSYYLPYTISNVTDTKTAFISLTAAECADLEHQSEKASKTLQFSCTPSNAPVAGDYADKLTFTVECKEATAG